LTPQQTVGLLPPLDGSACVWARESQSNLIRYVIVQSLPQSLCLLQFGFVQPGSIG
jgi:hypothetical protein